VEDKLYIKLLQLRRRQAWVQAIAHALKAGLWGGWLSIVLVLVLAGLRLPPQSQLEALLIWPALTVLGFLHGLLRPHSLRQIAHQADQIHGLQDRILTCLGHLQAQKPDTAVTQMLLSETLLHLDSLDPRRTYPNVWRRPLLRWLVPGLAFTLTVILLAQIQVDRAEPWQQEVLASRQRLTKLTRRLATRRPNSVEAQRLEKLLQRLPQQIPAQAARQMRQELQKIQQQLASQSALAEQVEAMRQKLQSSQGSATRAEQARKLAELQKQLSPQHSAQAPLQQARQALESGQSESAQKALEQSQESLRSGEEVQEQMASSEALQQELQQLDPSGATAQDQASQGTISQAEAQGQPIPGQGKGQADFGKGSTNEQTGKEEAAQQKARGERQHKRTPSNSKDYEKLYGVERHDLKARRERVSLSGAKGKLLKMPETQLGEAATSNPVLRAEQEDYLQAKALAEQSVAEEKIPSQHRDAVRRYFDQIDPRL